MSKTSTNCSYFLVEHPHDTTVIQTLSILITVVSTVINSIGCYVVLFKSRKETKLFRITLFGNLFSLWLGQGFWAIFMNILPLFPFPALYATNLFNSFLSTHTVFRVWIFLLSIFAVFLVGQLIVRHQMVVRTESFWNCPQWFYISILVVGWSFINFTMFVVWSYCDTSEEDKRSYVKENFPGCQEVFDLPGVLVVTNVYALYFLLGLMALIGAAAEGVYIVSSVLMLFELSKQTQKMSNQNFGHQKKVVVDTTIQIVIKSTFISTWAFWTVISYFIDPRLDTRVVSTIINCLFVSAPIPGTITMILLNTSYRNFVAVKILRMRPANVSPNKYALPAPGEVKSQFFVS